MKTNTFKQTIIGFISTIVVLTPLGADALTVEEVTNPRQDNGGWVTDMADILSDETETKLDRLISDLEATNGTEIAVVTVLDTASAATPKAFATELFNYWGIGKVDTDNGVLFLISVSDRRVEIETGSGLQTILPDSEVKEIIDNKITPQYKQGNYDRGTLKGTKALVVALDSTQSSQNWLLFPIAIIGGGITFFSTKGFLWWLKRRNNVYVNPSKTTVDLPRSDSREVHCAKCEQPMERETNIELTKAQQTASELGGVSYRGYKCLSCNDENPYVILAYISNSDRYQTCPDCQELTVIRSEEAIEEATQYSEGKRLITKKCHCCDYQTEKTTMIPRLYNHSTRRNHHNSSHTYVDSNSYSGGSYGGGSDSGGSFGGGSSDGGGAGGDW